MELGFPGALFARAFRTHKLDLAVRLGGWVVAALIVAAACVAIWQRDALEQEVIARENQAGMLATSRIAETILTSVESVLYTVEAYTHGSESHDVVTVPQSLLATLADELPFLNNILVLDRTGRIVRDSRPSSSVLGMDLSDRIYFREHDHPALQARTRPFIDIPMLSRVDGRWILPISRGIHAADGQFQGVIVAMLDIGYLTDALADAALDRQVIYAMIRSDGMVLTRWPNPQDRIGTRLPDNSLLQHMIARGQTEGWYSEISPIDGEHRLLHFQALKNFPIIMLVGRSDTGLLNLALIDLAPWLAIALLGTIAFPLGSIVIGRAMMETKLAMIRAEHADARKTQFLANTSHELRTPLNAILGYAEILRDDVFRANIPQRYRDYGAAIYASGEHLLAIVNDILDINVLLRDHVQLQEDDVLVEQLIAETLNLSGARSQGAIEVTIPGPAELAGMTLFCDERRSIQALVNLVGNALRHTPAGGVVAIRLDATAPGLRLIVEDSGPGVPDAVLKQLGRPFPTIGDSYVSSKQGTGLGLAITHRIMELHGGLLALSNRPEGGARAVLDFPEFRLIRTAR